MISKFNILLGRMFFAFGFEKDYKDLKSLTKTIIGAEDQHLTHDIKFFPDISFYFNGEQARTKSEINLLVYVYVPNFNFGVLSVFKNKYVKKTYSNYFLSDITMSKQNFKIGNNYLKVKCLCFVYTRKFR